MLIAEELLLLSLDDQSGKLMTNRLKIDVALAGGLLVELVVLGKIDIAGDGDSVKRGRLVVRNASRVGDPALDAALAAVTQRVGKKPASALSAIKKGVRETLLSRLAAAGEIRYEQHRLLGVIPTTRWPAAPGGHERGVRARLGDVLVRGTTPDVRTAALIGLLRAVGSVAKVVPSDDGRAVNQRAKAIADGQRVSDAVRALVRATQSGASAAVSAAG